MNKSQVTKFFLFVLLLIASLSLAACSDSSDTDGCTPPPDSFSETDLLGTWYLGWSQSYDQLTFYDDGTYQQTIHIESIGFDYTSEPLLWSMEYNDDIPYVHLEGMRLCKYGSRDCDQIGGGKGKWYDACREEWIEMPGEGILMVLGVLPQFMQPERGIKLVALTHSPDSGTAYRLKDTQTP